MIAVRDPAPRVLGLLLVLAGAAGTQALAAQSRPAAPSRPSAVVSRIGDYLQRAADFGQVNGVVLVAEKGRVIYEHAFGEANREWHVPNTTDTRFEIASMTKPMTALVIMQLVEEGRVRLDGHVSDYLPFYPKESGDRITVDQLLTHTSGIQQDIAFPDDRSGDALAAVVNADLLSNDSLVKLIAQRPLRFAPGTSYGYSSDAYAVLGSIIEHVTGVPYWKALEERLLRPAGMSETGVSLLRPLVPKRASGYAQTFAGYENAPHIGVTPAGGLYSTARDLYRFDRALYGDPLVRAATKDLIFAPRSVITAYGWKTSEEVRPDGSRRRILRTSGGLPGFGALMFRVPSESRLILFLGNARDLEWRFDDFAVALNHILDGEPCTLPRRSAAEVLAAAIRADRSGAALRARFEAMRRDTTEYAVSEAGMNQLGYFLLGQKRATVAVEIFSLNADAYPRSANVYDSLGEALLAVGDTVRAAASYRRSLALDSSNTNASAVLRRIGAH